MPRLEISPEENIVRAIRFVDWDEQKRRWSSQIFRGKNISVSRLSILNLEKLLKIFHKQLDKPPNLIIGAGEINVRVLKQIGLEYQPPIELTVEEDRLDENPAHAEIPQNISRGLAKRIIKELVFHLENQK